MIIVGTAETQVSTNTSTYKYQARTAMLENGGWVTTWISDWQDGSWEGVYQQAYNPDGTRLGGETAVNTTTANAQHQQQVTGLADGGWVVTWTSAGKVMQRIYGEDGVAVTGEVVVNTTTFGNTPFITALPNGGWVAAWTSEFWIYQKVYNANGTVAVADAMVNSPSDSFASVSQLTALSSGGWVLTYARYNSSDYDVYQRVYNSDGTAASGQVLVNTHTADTQVAWRVTELANGGWVTTWDSYYGQDGDAFGVYQQAFSANGTRVGSETQVNAHTAGDQSNSRVIALSNGGWVTAWTSYGQDGDGKGVYLRIFDAGGNAIGGEVQVNTYTTSDQALEDMVHLAGGGWVVTWSSNYQDLDLSGVFMQVFNEDGSTNGDEIRVNTTRSGYQSSSNIITLADGSWIVTWVGMGANGYGIQQKHFYPVDTLSASGAAGSDFMLGDAFDNTLDGGAGDDEMIGKAGNDTYIVDSAGDTVTENAGEGTDTVISSVAMTLSDNVENLTLTGSAQLGTGNALANILTGNGASELKGGAGDDTYIIQGNDVVTEYATVGTDTVRVAFAYTLGDYVENLVLTGTDSVNGTGNSLDNVLTGNAGINTLAGGLGNDTYIVQNTADLVQENENEGTDLVRASESYLLSANIENLTLVGSADQNYAYGNELANIITGDQYDNDIDGRGGKDTMIGGDGDDFYHVDDAADIVTEAANEGIDTIETSVTYTLSDNIEKLRIYTGVAADGTGNALNNTITGSWAANKLYGLAGNDTLEGDSGNDSLDGGIGKDSLVGGFGDDTYYVDRTSASFDTVTEQEDEGTDLVLTADDGYTLTANVENGTLLGTGNVGMTGNDLGNILTGNSGNNTLDGGSGSDMLIGGLGNDTYMVDTSADIVTELAGQGIDMVQSFFDYTLGANLENLVLRGAVARGTGNGLNNEIYGNAANNTLDGGVGNDTLYGFGGDDTYIIDAAGDIVVEAANAGTDTVRSGVSYTLLANFENLVLTGTGNFSATGNTLANTITGNSGKNVIDGGTGNDTLIGGAGDDTYIVNAAGDVIKETSTGGVDTVKSSASYTLSSYVENLTLTGTGNFSATGNTLANTITGNSGKNVLDGGAGNDTLIGGLGDDTYILNAAGDVVVEAANAGTDTVRTGASYTLLANFENLTLTGTGNLSATGNTLANTITGNSGKNVLDGGAGNDTLIGGLGDDTYIVNAAGDVIKETSTGGVDTVKSSTSYALSSYVEKLILTGSAANGTGNTLANTITGNERGNILDGGSGNDTLIGGLGNDTYIVNTTGDVVGETANAGTDTVKSATSYTISSNVEHLTLTGTSGISGSGNSLDNTITGNTGANLLNGGLGKDTLIGDAGRDTFVFDTKLGSTNIDTIKGFSHADDTIRLDDDIFTKVGGIGTLSRAAFLIGANADDADVRILYDSASGKLYYDADGDGAIGKVQFALLDKGLALQFGDFAIIA